MPKFSILAAASMLLIAATACCASDNGGAKTPVAQSPDFNLSQALLGIATSHQGQAGNPEALGKALDKDIGQLDLKGMGLKPVVATKADAEKLSSNLTGIKDLCERANAAWKLEHYRIAAMLYRSVTLATVLGSDNFVDEARDRLSSLESIAKKRLDAAVDSGLHDDFAVQARQLLDIINEFPDTAVAREAERSMGLLRTQPRSAAYLDLEEAKTLRQQGRIFEAAERFDSIADSPRYRDRIDCQIPCLLARRMAQEITGNAVLRLAIASQRSTKNERESHALLASAQNLLLNKMPADAKDKLNRLLELYPDSSAAKDAKKLLDDMK
jgi:hypothetical protein